MHSAVQLRAIEADVQRKLILRMPAEPTLPVNVHLLSSIAFPPLLRSSEFPPRKELPKEFQNVAGTYSGSFKMLQELCQG